MPFLLFFSVFLFVETMAVSLMEINEGSLLFEKKDNFEHQFLLIFSANKYRIMIT